MAREILERTPEWLESAAHWAVQAPGELMAGEARLLARANNAVLSWVTRNVLGSMIVFDLALIVPLLAIPASDSVKITLGVISGSWIQLWALPALQRQAASQEAKLEAKSEADRRTLTWMATMIDDIAGSLERLEGTINRDGEIQHDLPSRARPT